MQHGKMNVVMGAQAGSEAKGKLSGVLVEKFQPDILAGCLAPNAGHTIIRSGKKYVSHHIPVCAAIADAGTMVVLGPASVIRVPQLLHELDDLGIGYDRVMIDARAAIITNENIIAEQKLTKIGSTAQGVGAARAAKLWRVDSLRAIDVPELRPMLGDTAGYLNSELAAGKTVLYEMAQGFDLCLDHGMDPIYCTSRVVNPATAFGESGVSLRHMGDVYGVLRPYPIRVNNRDGFSGPYTGSTEITWEEVRKRSGTPTEADLTEITTTTRLPRRVFEFSTARFSRFIQICDPDYLCLQFANYVCYKDRSVRQQKMLSAETMQFVYMLEETAARASGEAAARVAYVGTGPEHADMVDMGIDIG